MSTIRNEKVLIRVDASAEIGFGHLMRCLTLADSLRSSGLDCVFASRAFDPLMLEPIVNKGHELITLQPLIRPSIEDKTYKSWVGANLEDEILELNSKIKDFRDEFGLFIVDHYGLDWVWESEFAKFGKIFVIDDLKNRVHDCDAILDSSFGTLTRDYMSLCRQDTHFLLGPKYCLIRPEFYQARQIQKNNLRKVLVMMGGTDPYNITSEILDIVSKRFDEIQIVAIVGRSCPHIDAIMKVSERCPDKVQVVVDPNRIAEVMSTCSVSIGACGTSAWERFVLGIPSIVITTAENQIKIAKDLHNDGLITYAGHFNKLDLEVIVEALSKLLKNTPYSLIEKIQKVCDGLGTERVSDFILRILDGNQDKRSIDRCGL